MKRRNENYRKIFVSFFAAFVIVAFSFFIYSLLTGKLSFSSLEQGWDGISIATQFQSGNGTAENPFIIHDENEFLYFKQLIEGEQYQIFQKMYYALDNDLNLSEKSFSTIGNVINNTENEERIFKGHLDGRGHTIHNILIDKPLIIDDVSYYNLFYKVEDANIKNINFDNLKIVTETSSEKVVAGLFSNINVSDKNDLTKSSEISNISLRNYYIDYSKNEEENNSISIISNSISSKANIYNIYLQGKIIGNNKTQQLGIVGNNVSEEISNIINNINCENIGESDFNYIKEKDIYNISKEKIYKEDKEITKDEMISLLNSLINDSYYWEFEDGYFSIKEKEINQEDVQKETTENIPNRTNSFSFSINSFSAGEISLHDTGIEGDTVYINDLDSDYNYYKGLDYSNSTNGTWPSGTSAGTYDDNKLARVYIAYHGDDINAASVVGKVSLTEQYSNFIYYKYYPIENGYVTIPLIDNPYGNRPNDRAFNGWITDYEGAVVSLDTDTYTRYVKVPARSQISITMQATWTEATVASSATSNSLKSATMQSVATGANPRYDVPTLYSRNTINSGNGMLGTAYPSGALNANGQSLSGQRCRRENNHSVTCTYYLVYTGTLTEGMSTLYELANGVMTSYVVPAPTGYDLVSNFMNYGDNVSGYFKKIRVNGALAGYYNNRGELQTSGSCNGGSSCDYYQLLQYDSQNIIDHTNYSNFYYLTTRDTNIVYLTGNIYGFTNTKPLTVTGINNGVNHTSYNINLNYSSINANADLRIEYCNLYSGQIQPDDNGPSSNNYYYIYGNFNNVKIGRGIPITEGTYTTGSWWNQTTHEGTYFNAKGIVGGSSSSTNTNPTKYSLVVESGNYNYISGVSTTSSSATYNVVATATYGNDLDRIKQDNEKMGVYYNVASSYGGTVSSGSNTVPFITTTIKSGTYGQDTEDTAAGAYVGGLNGGTINSPATMIVEGGQIMYLNGGPLISEDLLSYNSIYIYIKGGEIDCVFGGAARTETFGNRIISMTGGTVSYSIFGGSNGVEGNNSSSSKGTLNGKTFIRVGGDALVGTASDTVFGIEAGSIFGAGNGNSNYTTIGSVNDSRILIADSAIINKNVYGGGNYGAVVAQSGNASTSSIVVNGGHIKGTVYGGGNNNGSGSSSVTSTISIEVNNGLIDTSVYGGSRTTGTVYGSTTVTIGGGKINADVYGGGEGGYSSTNVGTYVRDNVSVVINNGEILGNVYGGSAYGSVNTINQNTNTSNSTTTVDVNGGTIHNNIFGGGKGSSDYTPKVVGNIVVTIDGGSIGQVFGGFDASGKPSATDVVYLNGGVIGNAFGGGNNASQDTTDIRLQGATINGNLYGGSNLLGTVIESNITVTSGSVVDIYGGNNLDGSTTTSNVSITGGTISGDVYGGGNEATTTTSNVMFSSYSNSNLDVYGGGKKAGVATTNVNLSQSTINRVFGGSNISGTVNTSNVHIISSNLVGAYGGNNSGGSTSITNVDTKNSTITNLYGGGDNAASNISNVVVTSGTITNLYGGGNEAGLTTSNVTVNNGTITNLFGGSNKSGDVITSNVIIEDCPISIDVSYNKRAPGNYPQSNKPTYAEITVTINNLTTEVIDNWKIALNIPNSTIFSNYSQSDITVSGNTFIIDSPNRYYGINSLAAAGSYTFEFSVLSDTPLNDFGVTSSVLEPESATSNINIQNVYGGNNKGGVTSIANVHAKTGNINTIYGGGNEAVVGTTNVIVDDVLATDIYGGGNAAGVSGNTSLDINGATISNNIYGGGNEGIVGGSTNVTITDASISGNAFAGGNGSTAVVQSNSTITIDGNTEVGNNSSEAPAAGCVFGSGNAASTGIDGVDNSTATVNIVGGTIHGNVYGGPKMAVVYGTTDTNIGTSAVSISGLNESDIHISGTVFGGGESNASGSETYDWTFISVTKGIDVTIDGTGYINNNHEFIMNGSIFGSGNASSSSGTANIIIKNLGSRNQPNKSISIQRANNLTIDHSVIELEGTTDRTNEYSDILYSFNIIDKLILKNDSVLLLQHNANLLKELYSGVDSNSSLVPAVVDIDDDNESITKNVDNRIYMLPGQNLNVTINQAATAYGKVTGMTFFGMYNAYDNGTYRYGLYDDNLDYGDSGNAGLEIVGGSYVIGLHNVNHDITKDGFYSNYLNDDYTKVTVAYIDPSPIGETGYRWIIGFEAINYEFTLTASKYSSLGTYELQLIDFADGNTNFSAIGFDSSGLNSGIQLVDSINVPRVGRTETQANNILGLSMKAETQEWTGYGTTKLLSQSGGSLTGDRDYKTDSRKLPPSLMFYLYHAKNINSEGRLGTVVLTLRADIPKNAIDYDIKFITVTINLVARKYDDGDSYDAAITYDKRYDMPSSTLVNITNQSQFSTYYSLIAWTNQFENMYGNNNTNYHVLTTNNPLPVNTMITMLDYGANPNRPEYYYFKVTQDIYNDSLQQLTQYNEVVYPLSSFIKMDSTTNTNTYQDNIANHAYYDEDNGLVDEEFVFIFDFKETTTTGEHLNNTMLFELRNNEGRTICSVLGIRESLMVYNTYDSSNIVLNQTFANNDTYLYYNVVDEFNYATRIQYNETENRQSVIDTNYESSSMGINVSFYDREGTPVSSSMLIGTSITIDNHEYFADGDGVFRIKLANKVSNLNRILKLTVNKDLPAGAYTIRYTLFASDDGLHNSIYENSVTQDFVVYVVSADNSITVDCDDKDKIVDGSTGKNMNNNTTNTYHIKYNSQLTNPNLRVELFKRNTDTIDSSDFTSIPFRYIFSNAFVTAQGNEMYLDMNGLTERNLDFNLQSSLTSGTYRIVFKLYDSNQLIDTETKYLIIHKKSQ